MKNSTLIAIEQNLSSPYTKRQGLRGKGIGVQTEERLFTPEALKYCKKESVYITKEFNSHRTGHQHRCHFIVLKHQWLP